VLLVCLEEYMCMRPAIFFWAFSPTRAYACNNYAMRPITDRPKPWSNVWLYILLVISQLNWSKTISCNEQV